MITLDNYSMNKASPMERVKANKTLRTDEEWREEYWRETQIPPRILLKKALASNDEKIRTYATIILDEYHHDNRRRKPKTPEDFIPDGRWYMLVNLIIMIKSRRVNG